MSEPTDHRAEAEYWLERAGDPDLDMGLVPTYCLIGIGHALLALGNPQPTYVFRSPEPLDQESLKRAREALRHGEEHR